MIDTSPPTQMAHTHRSGPHCDAWHAPRVLHQRTLRVLTTHAFHTDLEPTYPPPHTLLIAATCRQAMDATVAVHPVAWSALAKAAGDSRACGFRKAARQVLPQCVLCVMRRRGLARCKACLARACFCLRLRTGGQTHRLSL